MKNSPFQLPFWLEWWIYIFHKVRWIRICCSSSETQLVELNSTLARQKRDVWNRPVGTLKPFHENIFTSCRNIRGPLGRQARLHSWQNKQVQDNNPSIISPKGQESAWGSRLTFIFTDFTYIRGKSRKTEKNLYQDLYLLRKTRS